MSNKLDDLIDKFKKEENTTGERIAYALKNYLCDFTEALETKVNDEKNSSNRVVQKIKNMMINCTNRGDYSARHMFPVVAGKEFNILSKEIDDKIVLERINTEIRKCQNGNGIEIDGMEIGSHSYKVPVGYIYTNVTKSELEHISKNGKNSLVVEDKSGEKHRLDYYLIWSEIAILNCKRMWQLTKLYKDENPIVFAPYAKRLFRIEIDIEEIVANKGIQIKSIDFLLQENGLDNMFMLGKELVWNVKIEKRAEFSKKKTPVSDAIHWKYYFKDLLPCEYIIPKNITWPTFRAENISDKEVSFDFENEYLGEFEKISIFEINENDFEKQEIYWPQYNLRKLARQNRIRSFADAYYEAKKFESVLPEGIRISCVQTNIPEGKMIIEKFPVNMTVYNKGRFGYKNTNRLIVVFDCENDNMLNLDYFNFVLGYLTFCFPEIGWEGAV